MTKEDLLRKSYEIALQTGRHFQNSETHFVHKSGQVGIPYYENALFCLALFRSKTQEAIQEGKQILDRLLHFQQMNKELPSSGNFPVYLHDYPYCRDHYLAPKIALIWKMLQKDFSTILGDELRTRLQKSLLAASSFSSDLLLKHSMPLFLKQIIELIQDEKAPLPGIENFQLQDYDRESLGMLLAAIYSTRASIADSGLYKFIQDTYHYPSKIYCGPAFRHFQSGFDVQTSIYDHMIGALTGALPERALKIEIAALQAVLTQMPKDRLTPCYTVTTGRFQNSPWKVVNNELFAVAIIEPEKEMVHPGFYCLQMITGGKVISLVAPKSTITTFIKDDGIEAKITLQQNAFEGTSERKKVFSLIFPSQGAEVLVEGKQATAFSLGDSINVIYGKQQLSISLEKSGGDTSFFGNIGPAERASCSDRVENALDIYYDKELALRYLRGSNAEIILKIKIDRNDEVNCTPIS